MADQIQTMEAEELDKKPFDASDPEAVNNARKKAGRKKAMERDTLKTLMEHENGRKLMFDSVKCILSGNPVIPNEPYATYFNLGQEYRARHIFKEIVRIAPEEFAVMIEENKDEL